MTKPDTRVCWRSYCLACESHNIQLFEYPGGTVGLCLACNAQWAIPDAQGV